MKERSDFEREQQRQVLIDVAANAGLMRLLLLSGCTTAVRAFRDAGIMIYGTFVFGYDHDTADTFDTAVEFAVEHRFFLANFNPGLNR